MSSLASFVVFVVLLFNSLPVNGVNFGSISVSLQTSDNIFAVRYLRSLCLIDTKFPSLQLIQCCVLNLLPQVRVVSKYEMLHPYRKRSASKKYCYSNSKPKSLIGSAVSQFDTPFSMLISSNFFWIFLINYLLIDLSWCGIFLFFFDNLFSHCDLSLVDCILLPVILDQRCYLSCKFS